MNERAEVLLMHARELESMAENCWDKHRNLDVPGVYNNLMIAAERIEKALVAVTNELGRRMVES